MRNFIIRFIGFLLFGSFIYVVLIIAWGSIISSNKYNLNYLLGETIGAPDFLHSRIKESKCTQNIDILFLGSSHSLRGFDPRIFTDEGYSTFNLGSNAQTPLLSEFILNRYIDHLNPKIVIMEVCPYTFSVSGIESALELISNDIIKFDNIVLAIKLNNIRLYNTLIFAYYKEIVSDDKLKFRGNNINGLDKYIKGGYVQRMKGFYINEDFLAKKWLYKHSEIEVINRIANQLNERNIKLILIQAPMTSDFYESYQNNDAFDNEMIKLAYYANFNELIKLKDSLHFWDFNHMNQSGVKIFNNELIKLLKKDALLKKSN